MALRSHKPVAGFRARCFVAARALLLMTLLTVLLRAAEPSWLDLVTPIVSPAEKKAWLGLTSGEREKFEQEFWTDKAISAEEYFKRLAYADATWGGPQRGSSANTDQGRVYLGLGPPNRISRFPSSRIFVPMEIWYYSVVPGILNTELRLIFFQPNNAGFFHLYSPATDTIRALLLNESGTRTVFSPNDVIDENMLRQNLNVPPAEDEILSASVNVATGIKYSGNDEIIGEVTSPREMLTRAPKTSVETRFIAERPRAEFLVSQSRFGGSQVDLSADVRAKSEVSVEVLEGQATVYRNVLKLNLTQPRSVQYIHRIDLLPGSYRVLIGVDGQTFPSLLEVHATPSMSEIMRASQAQASLHTPFEFADYRLYPDADGRYVVVTLPHPMEVQWSIRQNAGIVWRQKTAGTDAAVLTLPLDKLPPGRYQIEAVAGDESKSLEFELKSSSGKSTGSPLLSFNANLAPAARHALVGHEWLLRGQIGDAQSNLEAALAAAPIQQARIDLARIDALASRWDDARSRLQAVLAEDPANFEALCVYAFIETDLQDYRAATELYRKALAIQDSPVVRLALARLPQQ
jgi:GWxTD domain-containing protein